MSKIVVSIECEHCGEIINFKEHDLSEFVSSFVECPECKQAMFISKPKFINADRYEV